MMPFRLSRSGLSAILVAAFAVTLWVAPARAATAPKQKRPNFLFILTDDQSPETLSAYGNTVCQTPNIDRLARRGIVLDDAHHMGSWSGAVCTPSRTMIMTGRTVWRIPGARGPGISQSKMFRTQAARESLAAVFNRAGYDTFRTCKRGNSFKQANSEFTVSRVATKRQGTPEGGSRWHGDQVLEFLEQRQKIRDRDPFLIYFGFSHPHDPRTAIPELAARYGAVNRGKLTVPNPKAPPLPLNYLPAHPFPHGHPGLRDEVRVQGVLKRRDEATIRNELGREYACIENIDRQVGRVLEKLAALGERDNTYVFFTSDHGIAVGRHGLTGKQNLYEHTWRVPLIATGPGIKPGTRASGYTYLLDVLPTLCDLAGIAAPASVEGKSFRAVLEGKAQRVRDVLYGVYTGGTKPGMRAIKTDGWKLIKYDVLDGTVRRTQLFDLRNNPREFLVEHRSPRVTKLLGHTPRAEQINLASSPQHAVKRRELEDLLKREMKRLGDPYQLTD
ncbi:MAG: sulfatase-like hydrolase/transferase [Planctomycetaceae bacterium]